jgi:capsular exopolysaccharide synthesis family protein
LNSQAPTPFADLNDANSTSGNSPVNFKRILGRIVQFWYLVLISLLVGVSVAYIINRYTTKIFPVKASIIIRESEENAGAKFLYDNALINPYRNFFNEIYIMKSYPLLQEVVEALGFEVSFYREGEILTTEHYYHDFPVQVSIGDSQSKPWGMSMYFVVNDTSSYSLQYVTDSDVSGRKFDRLSFNDTVSVNGFRICVRKKRNLEEIIGKTFIVKFNNPLALAQDYSTRLMATWAAPGASVVNLDITGPVAAKEIDFLNKFIERYQLYDIEKKSKVATMAMKFLDEQLIITGDSLNRYEAKVEDFKNRNIITGLGEETNRLYLKLQTFEDRKFQYRLNESYYKYIGDLMSADQYDGIFTPASVGITDPIIAALITQVINIQTQVSVYKSNQSIERSKENPLLKSAQQQISFLKKDILRAIENNRKTEAINIRFIDDQIKLVDKQLARLPNKERELVDIQRNYSLKESLYVFLLQKKTEAGLSKASTTSDIVIVNPPLAGGPISPKILQNYLIGSGLGLMIPLLIFVIIELLNNKIQSKEDIEGVTSVPFVGAIGHSASVDPLIVFNKPRSALAEAFRALRSNLNYFTNNKSTQVFMVTSTIPGEGKSFTSLNIATVFALAGKRTVLMGADLRRPKLAEELGLENKIGLSQFLSGLSTIDHIIQQTKVPNLSLIAGGPMPPNPSELLLRPEMDQLVSELLKTNDIIIIDTPPLSLVADAFVLSKYADHTLYVVRQNFTPMMALRSLDEAYMTGKLPKVSVLFNDLRKTGFGYGYSGYAYGYGYRYNYGYGKNGGHGYYSE